jgi:YfiH family protein
MKLFIQPKWPAPAHIKACTTLRTGGVSQHPYDQFNLGDHVGDRLEHLIQNREILKNNLGLTQEPIWIRQTHSTIAIEATTENAGKEADASFTNQANQTCIILTADCLPILLCHRDGNTVAAIHAGWRGLANGIIENTLEKIQSPREDWLVWLGPAISSKCYEVGDEVREQFIRHMPQAETAFHPSPNKRWMADLYELARMRLRNEGIQQIYGGEYCTYSDPTLFYSYRRDGEKTGRMASLIWIDSRDKL